MIHKWRGVSPIERRFRNGFVRTLKTNTFPPDAQRPSFWSNSKGFTPIFEDARFLDFIDVEGHLRSSVRAEASYGVVDTPIAIRGLKPGSCCGPWSQSEDLATVDVLTALPISIASRRFSLPAGRAKRLARVSVLYSGLSRYRGPL